MSGRWRVQPAGRPVLGTPWLVLRGRECQAVQRNGPVLELDAADGRGGRALGPDIMADPARPRDMLARLRAADQARELGDALLDQRLVVGHR